MDVHKRKARAALISVFSNTSLVAVKVVVGLLTGSVSVLSEAIHSGIDLVAAAIALFAVRKAHKPADEDHPYGHGKVENLSGMFEALLILVAAGWIIYEAVGKLLNPQPLELPALGVGVMAISAIVNVLVSRMLFRVGRETESVALEADAWHLRTDVYTSIGVMIGLLLVWFGRWLFPGTDLVWLDPLAAIAVALLILRAAIKLTVQSIRDLLDERLPEDERVWIAELLTGLDPEIRGFHRLRTRKAGTTRFVELHLLVSGDMHVDASHAITDKVAAAIRERFNEAAVTVHVEPCDGACEALCVEGCLLDEQQREQIKRDVEKRQP